MEFKTGDKLKIEINALTGLASQPYDSEVVEDTPEYIVVTDKNGIKVQLTRHAPKQKFYPKQVVVELMTEKLYRIERAMYHPHMGWQYQLIGLPSAFHLEKLFRRLTAEEARTWS